MKIYCYSSKLLSWVCFCYLMMTNSISLAQEPPPHLKLIFSDSTISKVAEKYELSTSMYRAAEFGEPKTMDEKMRERLLINDGKGYCRVYIFGENMRLPLKGDLYSFTVKEQSGASMTVFIRTSYSLSYAEEIVIQNISFKEGTYFLDMCVSKSQFQIPAGKSDNTTINLQELTKYKTSVKKIRKLLKSNQC